MEEEKGIPSFLGSYSMCITRHDSSGVQAVLVYSQPPSVAWNSIQKELLQSQMEEAHLHYHLVIPTDLLMLCDIDGGEEHGRD